MEQVRAQKKVISGGSQSSIYKERYHAGIPEALLNHVNNRLQGEQETALLAKLIKPEKNVLSKLQTSLVEYNSLLAIFIRLFYSSAPISLCGTAGSRI